MMYRWEEKMLENSQRVARLAAEAKRRWAKEEELKMDKKLPTIPMCWKCHHADLIRDETHPTLVTGLKGCAKDETIHCMDDARAKCYLLKDECE